MKKLVIYISLITLVLSSCSSNTATGAAFGSIIGSAVGGIAGGCRGSDIGTLVGMATGAAIGAAADAKEDAERARYYESRRQRAYDDMYEGSASTQYRSQTDYEKAQRVRQYHENTERKYRSGNGFSFQRASDPIRRNSTSGTYTRSNNNQSTQYSNTSSEPDSSGRVSTPQYDDRIEMK